MRVEHLAYAPPVNASEELACAQIQKFLRGRTGDARFVLITNLAHSIHARALRTRLISSLLARLA
jgi:hypothetical protein